MFERHVSGLVEHTGSLGQLAAQEVQATEEGTGKDDRLPSVGPLGAADRRPEHLGRPGVASLVAQAGAADGVDPGQLDIVVSR